MTEEQYARWTAPLRAHPRATRALLAANKLLTIVGYVAYPLLLVLLALEALGFEDGGGGSASAGALLARCIIVPAISFVAVSAFRRVYNAPRPYEALDIQPLIAKDTRGKSFPSRHTFSMFMIAASWLAYQPIVGCALLTAGIVMGTIRVLGGVHFPRDVIAGALAAAAAGLVGYVLIP